MENPLAVKGISKKNVGYKTDMAKYLFALLQLSKRLTFQRELNDWKHPILGFRSRDETAMLLYKTMEKYLSS